MTAASPNRIHLRESNMQTRLILPPEWRRAGAAFACGCKMSCLAKVKRQKQRGENGYEEQVHFPPVVFDM